MNNHDHIRTIIEFRNEGRIFKTVNLHAVLPNVEIGHMIVFDPSGTEDEIAGKVSGISHVVFLGSDPPITYIDADV